MSANENTQTISDSQFEVSLGNVGPGSRVFGRYKLEKELGRGGMGVVWLAHDDRVDVQVALKFLPDIVARDAESVEELKRELRRGLNLTHPGIVRVYSFEQDETGAAIAMEYVDGPTLSALKLTQAAQCFDVDDLLPMLEQLCAALDYAHFEAKIVHRDLKPRNLMLTSKGRLKIADFGVATSISDTVSRATMRKDGSGTPPYMSPQQAFGENPSPGDDLYSLGATFYELLTGRPPFYQGNILAQVQQRVPPSLAERREVLKIAGKKPIPPEWEATIAACLAKMPEDRPQRASEMLEMLRGLRPPPQGGHTETQPINPALSPAAIPHPTPRRKDAADDDIDTHLAGSFSAREESTARGKVKTAPVPPQKRSQAGALAVLALLVAAGAGIWWSQQQKDENAHVAVPTRTPVQATPDPALAQKKAAVEQQKKAADEKQMRSADEEAAAAGRIPKGDAPWENSLQMKFVPVPGVAALVSTFETRVADYREFAAETKRPWTPTEFIQGDEHPAVNVSWIDAVSFCEWLTNKERAAGNLGKLQRYRLLTDAEWSRTVGLAQEPGKTPREKDRQIKDFYPWGTASVPPNGTENLAGEGETVLSEKEVIGYRDGYSHTAPVGHFQCSAQGIYDLGGNAAEWVEDWFDTEQTERTTRGAAFIYIADFDRCSSFRWHLPPNEVADYIGFRVALDLGAKP
jgi:serine/threonine protein kinase/formylglycine-generating enzyme required for sulfatase activity